jgi:uncharacterized protein (TIGR02145 family)
MINLKNTGKGLIISIGLLLMIASSCNKEVITTTKPVIASAEIFSISSNAVTFRSKIVSAGSLEVTAQGLCWSKSPSPTTENNVQPGDLKDSTLFCRTIQLTPNTKYYARLFATNSAGTAYSNEIMFTTNSTVTDIDGNVYNTVSIGSQVWMVENLKTTRFVDGTNVPLITNNSDWDNLSTAVYCWYDNSTANGKIYGALYNWPTVNSGKLCPAGWHVPSDAEWSTLTNYLGGDQFVAGLLKEVGVTTVSQDITANNYSGFSALPGGSASVGNPKFLGNGYKGIWWSSTIDTNEFNIYRSISFDGNTSVERNGFMSKANALNGLSVRCIKD